MFNYLAILSVFVLKHRDSVMDHIAIGSKSHLTITGVQIRVSFIDQYAAVAWSGLDGITLY